MSASFDTSKADNVERTAVTGPEFVIGRNPDCDLHLANQHISRRHCALLIRGNKAFVRDLGSMNGTSINGERVKDERELHNDDRLEVGRVKFRVVLEARPPYPPADGASPEQPDVLLALEVQGTTTQGNPTPMTLEEADALGYLDGAETFACEDPEATVDKADVAKLVADKTSSSAKAILEKYMRR
jgi:predicted component of type VI protein secretion system